MGAAACEVLTLLVLAAIVEQATGFIAPGIGRLRHCQGTTEGMVRVPLS